jgi:hypothetical protein
METICRVTVLHSGGGERDVLLEVTGGLVVAVCMDLAGLPSPPG